MRQVSRRRIPAHMMSISDLSLAQEDGSLTTTLATGRAPGEFHFTRVFTRSVGTTPHRYIAHLRVQRAIELVRNGRSGLAEVAAGTGSADQSHLSRWVCPFTAFPSRSSFAAKIKIIRNLHDRSLAAS